MKKFLIFFFFVLLFSLFYPSHSALAHPDRDHTKCSSPVFSPTAQFDTSSPLWKSYYAYSKGMHEDARHYFVTTYVDCSIATKITKDAKYSTGVVTYEVYGHGSPAGSSAKTSNSVYFVNKVDIYLTDEKEKTYHKGTSNGTTGGSTAINGHPKNTNNSGLVTYSDEDMPKVNCIKTYGGTQKEASCTDKVTVTVDQNFNGKKGQRLTCYYFEDPFTHDSDKVCTVRIYVKDVKITSGPSTTYTGKHHNYECTATFYDGKTRVISQNNKDDQKYVWLSYPSNKNMKTFYDGRYIGSQWENGYKDPRGLSHIPNSLHDFYPVDPENREYMVNCTYYPGLDWVLQHYGGEEEGFTNWIKKETNMKNDANELYFYLDQPIYQAKKFQLIDADMFVHPEDHGGYKTQIYVRDYHTKKWILIFDHAYQKTTYLGGMVVEFPARDIDAIRFDSDRDVDQNYHNAGGAIVSFYVQKPVTNDLMKKWGRIVHTNGFVSDYDLESSEPWHVPKNASKNVTHIGIEKIWIETTGEFSNPALANSYTKKTLLANDKPVPFSGGWKLLDTVNNKVYSPGHFDQESFITGHWYDFKAYIQYKDGTKREVTSAEEVYWNSTPWFKDQKKFSVKNVYDSGMSKTGLDHRIPEHGWNTIDVEYLHQNVPFGNTSYNKTKVTARLQARQIKKIEIKHNDGYTKNPVSVINVNNGDSKKVQYRSFITWTDDAFEDWTNAVYWDGDYYSSSKKGFFDFTPVKGLNEKSTVYAHYKDTDNLIGTSVRVNNKGESQNLSWNSNQANWDANHDKIEVTITDCNTEHIAWNCPVPPNYWRTDIKGRFDLFHRSLNPNSNFYPDYNLYNFPNWDGGNDLYVHEGKFPVSGTSSGVGNQ